MTSHSEEQAERAINLAMSRMQAINNLCGAISADHKEPCHCMSCRVLAGDEGAYDVVAGICDSLGSMQDL
jgi:hypothetical protein